MPKAVTLIRSNSLSNVAEYAYAATAPAEARLVFPAGSCPLNDDGSTYGESEVIRDGLRALFARDRAVEAWLRDEVAASYGALQSHCIRRREGHSRTSRHLLRLMRL